MKLFKFGMSGAALALAATSPVSAQDVSTKIGPWMNTVEVTETGHVIGNPDAETVLTEFVSYTCSTCARFSVEGDPALDLVYISTGRLRFEVRPFIRNALDLTISMLVACGDPKKFKGNHAMFLRSQGKWLPQAANAPKSQQGIWGRGDRGARMSMSSALGLSDKMIKQRGLSRVEVNTCLADDAKAQSLMANTNAAAAQFDIDGTPTFAINGEVLPEVHGWEALYPALTAHFEALRNPNAEPELGESQFDL
ncbi:MAG: thioredoxin domain-containing protein [Pseudomonadota bacterium]